MLDCWNNYEMQVGKFELAEPSDMVNFRESWEVLQEQLKDMSKDALIMTYCMLSSLSLCCEFATVDQL